MFKLATASPAPIIMLLLLLVPCTVGALSPPELQATAGVGYVDLNWNAVAGADNYTVYRLDGGELVPLVDVRAPFTSYHDTEVRGGDTYLYGVTAWVEGNESGMSNTVSITVPARERGDVVLPILAIVMSLIAVQVCVVLLLYFAKIKFQLK